MQVLDRVLDRDDVTRAGHVDRVDQRGQARRLPRTGRPAEHDESLLQRDELLHGVWQPDLVERRDRVLDEPQRHGHLAALVEGVAAETVGPEREREVDIAVAFEVVALRAVEQVGEVVAHERLVDRPEAFDRSHRAVEADHRGATDRQDEVGARHSDDGLEGRAQGGVNLHQRSVSAAFTLA